MGVCGAVGKKDLVGSDGTNGRYNYQGPGSPWSPFFSPVRNSEVRHSFSRGKNHHPKGIIMFKTGGNDFQGRLSLQISARPKRRLGIVLSMIFLTKFIPKPRANMVHFDYDDFFSVGGLQLPPTWKT